MEGWRGEERGRGGEEGGGKKRIRGRNEGQVDRCV